MRRTIAIIAGLVTVLAGLATTGSARAAIGGVEGTPLEDTPVADAPLPEPAALDGVPAAACSKPDDVFEASHWGEAYGRYGDDCRRLRFAYGPITVKPGQNDALLVPVTIEKPLHDGYIVRFKPDLLLADGTAPWVDEIHLHHSVWLRGEEALGGPASLPPGRYSEEIIPFFAAGEEKTIATFPHGYGYRVRPTDSWMLLYMVHNYTSQTEEVWITYDVDFVAADTPSGQAMQEIHPVWLDVQRRPVAANAPNTPANPVFNVQRGFGTDGTCTWPRENCAAFDAYGDVSANQGEAPIDPGTGTPTELLGAHEPIDYELGDEEVGSLVWMGGHLHPGGIADEVQLVRPGPGETCNDVPDDRAAPIFTSEGVAWDRGDPQYAGGPNDSWDFSMSVTGSHLGWKPQVQKGDCFRINATYDSTVSWYENMGITVGFVARGDGSGVDPLAASTTVEDGVPAGAVVPLLPDGTDWRPADCTADLCTRGQPTHGHLPEAGRFGGCGDECPALVAPEGDPVDTVVVADFSYGQADQGVAGLLGVPTVAPGDTVTFVNGDSPANIWHTVTRCAAPCTGGSGLAYPKADGADFDPSTADDYDSAEVGYGLFLSPAKVHVDEAVEEFGWGWWENPFNPPIGEFVDELEEGVLWEFTPDASDAGELVTFYCRIHIGMRGAVQVTDSTA